MKALGWWDGDWRLLWCLKQLLTDYTTRLLTCWQDVVVLSMLLGYLGVIWLCYRIIHAVLQYFTGLLIYYLTAIGLLKWD